MSDQVPHTDNCFLPDFCSLRMVFAVVILAQLFAFVMALMSIQFATDDLWKHTSMVSLFVQWAALSSSALLCYLRKRLCQLPALTAALLSYLVVVTVVLVLSEIGFQLLYFDLSLGNNHIRFLLRNGIIAVMVAGPVLRYFYVQQAWQRNVRAEAQSRLVALQSRIRPHFLFNSLNTIASLIRTEPARAETAIEDLSDLFRVSLRDARQYHTLADEIELCDRYLEIEKLRLGDRLQVAWEVNDVPQDALIPPILLQPLIENAIYHGIETLSSGGMIRISGTKEKNKLVLRIENPCETQHGSINSGHHMAQNNIRERLTGLYGKASKLHIEAYADRYIVEITLPYRNTLDEDSDRG